jgi:hypothetical protein
LEQRQPGDVDHGVPHSEQPEQEQRGQRLGPQADQRDWDPPQDDPDPER